MNTLIPLVILKWNITYQNTIKNFLYDNLYYQIYYLLKKTDLYQKGEIDIEDGVTFRDMEGRAIIIVDSDDAINYVRYLYEKDITKLIKGPQEIWDDDANIDFTNKETKLVIDSVLIHKWWYWENIL